MNICTKFPRNPPSDRQTLPSIESSKTDCLQALYQHIKDRPFKFSLVNNKLIIQKKGEFSISDT